MGKIKKSLLIESQRIYKIVPGTLKSCICGDKGNDSICVNTNTLTIRTPKGKESYGGIGKKMDARHKRRKEASGYRFRNL